MVGALGKIIHSPIRKTVENSVGCVENPVETHTQNPPPQPGIIITATGERLQSESLRVRKAQTLEPDTVSTGAGSRLSNVIHVPIVYKSKLLRHTQGNTPATQPTKGRKMKKLNPLVAVLFAGALTLSACGSNQPATETPKADAEKAPVKVLAYDSLEFTDEQVAEFEKTSGYKLEIIQVGSGGELTNKLVLTKDNPEGDVAFGVDSIGAYRAVKEGVFAKETPELSDAEKALQITDAPGLVPFNQADVCVNADPAWFKEHNLEVPATFADLKDPKYKDLLVAMNPTSSTPGLAFFMATVAAEKDGWKDYWTALKANGVKITKGWSDAFNTDFSAGEGKGDRPLMVSYGSSPAWAVNKEITESSIVSLPQTCFRTVEYVGVLQNAKNVEGAQAFVKFVQQAGTQEVFVANNYVHPVNPDVKLPEALAKFGPLSADALTLDAKTIEENQAKWLEEWSELLTK